MTDSVAQTHAHATAHAKARALRNCFILPPTFIGAVRQWARNVLSTIFRYKIPTATVQRRGIGVIIRKYDFLRI
jgi:hypothetical protein